MKSEIGRQIEACGLCHRLYALRNNDAVNRLAMLSMILGIGALGTGFYGMNIPHLSSLLNNGAFSKASLTATGIMTVLSLSLIVYIVASNWVDYRASLLPASFRRPLPNTSLRRMVAAEPNRQEPGSRLSPSQEIT